MTIYIEDIVKEANRITDNMLEQGGRDKKVLALCIEINQRYKEYLDELETADLQVSNGVRVAINGQVVQFKNMDDFAEWVAEHAN